MVSKQPKCLSKIWPKYLSEKSFGEVAQHSMSNQLHSSALCHEVLHCEFFAKIPFMSL